VARLLQGERESSGKSEEKQKESRELTWLLDDASADIRGSSSTRN
jgi:hypothetical protein